MVDGHSVHGGAEPVVSEQRLQDLTAARANGSSNSSWPSLCKTSNAMK
ncbi:hypothetical protein OG379_01640 [Streptomyces sp. NBC_01166]|nr:hypothetical protein OG379_01640 [Streptomyces sp. NBC_01166]